MQKTKKEKIKNLIENNYEYNRYVWIEPDNDALINASKSYYYRIAKSINRKIYFKNDILIIAG